MCLLRVKHVESNVEALDLDTESLKFAGARNLTPETKIMVYVSPFQQRPMDFPDGKFPTAVGQHGE